VAIGIVSGGVNDVVSGCLPVAALTAAPAAVVVTRAAIVIGGGGWVVNAICCERKLDLRNILECCDDKSQQITTPQDFSKSKLQALPH